MVQPLYPRGVIAARGSRDDGSLYAPAWGKHFLVFLVQTLLEMSTTMTKGIYTDVGPLSPHNVMMFFP